MDLHHTARQLWRVLAFAIPLLMSQAELSAVISGTNPQSTMETWRGTKNVRFRITPEESAEQVGIIMQSIDSSISSLSPKNLTSVTKSVHTAFPKGPALPPADDRPKTLAWISDRLTKAIQEAHNDLGPYLGFVYASAAVSKSQILTPKLKCAGKVSIKIGDGLLVSHIRLEAAPEARVVSKDQKRDIATKALTIRGNVAIHIKVIAKFPRDIELPGETTFSRGIQDVKISKKGTKEDDLTFTQGNGRPIKAAAAE